MKRILAVILLIITITLVYISDNSKFGIPALGKLLSPTHGVWQNKDPQNQDHIQLTTPNGIVDIYYDDRGVPHLFAPNEAALYYAVGYAQAKDRLWQMDFQTRVAGGKLSEAIGEENGLNVDRYIRRLGLPKIAEETALAFKDDSLSQSIIKAYSSGINDYIDRLQPKDLPIEFKLADYKPEPWTDVKSILLLKLMSLRLSNIGEDIRNTSTRNIIGEEAYDIIFPDFPQDQSPIIPIGTSWNFEPVVSETNNQFEEDYVGDNSASLPNPLPYVQGIGSNNWAVGPNKTADGSVILSNDPHLGLSYPSIWYEMQLNAPGINVYGVTIPGAPNIIIGFNENIAWGVTNGSRDVNDWYSVRYKDDSQSEYLLDGEYYPIEKRIETINVNNGESVIDTVRWTKVGPIVYDNTFGKLQDKSGLAMQWMALNVTNEMKTFYELNMAKNHDEYLSALKYFDNPGQNFVYGDVNGNIAIQASGLYKIQQKNEGKYVAKLEDQNLENLNTYVPKEHNPHILNPDRNFVSSANQQPTDSTYPYYYTGSFETYRNRRINSQLASLENITVEDMMLLQNDNFNLMAAEILPFLLEKLDAKSLSKNQIAILDSLKNWDYFNEPFKSAPTYFQSWWVDITTNLWDELNDTTKSIKTPQDYYTLQFLKNHADHSLIDNKTTKPVETVEMLINNGFKTMSTYFINNKDANSQWFSYNNARVEHLMKFKAFSTWDIEVGGSENAPNAVNQEWGPSWRMVVKLNDNGVEAYGVYPGGQSGNPGNAHYDDFLENWRTGQYFKLNFYKDKEEAQQSLKAK
ncbi:MAG: penicillin acylase family protein [Chitinophagales bacterium]